ncbi:octopamine receptor beta-2R-like [Clytia hemisphaerica]|uniref:octopamine receptor beta-2R-like n=1 Tax=Clytia hemisphaerica TaxID=252671 RepID=UPI0034D66EDE
MLNVTHNMTTWSNTTLPQVSDRPLEMIIPLMLSCVVAVLANSFVCFLILRVERLRSATNVFVFSLCLCDILFAGVLLPMHCFYQHDLVYQFLTLITVLIYIVNMACTTFERLICITKPMRYLTYLTKTKAIRIVITAWIFPALYCCIPLSWHNNTQILIHKLYLVFSLLVFLLLPFVFIAYVYIRICGEIKRLNRHNPHNSSSLSEQLRSSKRKCSLASITSCLLVKRDSTVDKDKIQVDLCTDDRSSDCTSITSTEITSTSDRRTSFNKKPTAVRSKKSKKSSRSKKKKEIRASLPFAITTFMYMFTWLPVIYLTILDTIDRLDLAPMILLHFSIFAIALNAVCVPFIYGLLLPGFRLTLFRMFTKQK